MNNWIVLAYTYITRDILILCGVRDDCTGNLGLLWTAG